ncbi:MAG: twin-arginine translocation signal domain-containing protein, partial [Sedimentisphaerales bacterium]|nr:twin-arginine translocation signal domain-containing protein [Sedimentisphaerales bacterium]
MNRRTFLKVSGMSVAAAASGCFAGSSSQVP